MQFTHSQGFCISKKCFLPRVAIFLLLPKVLIHFHIPLSLSCFLHPFLVSLWYLRPFPVLSWWLNIPQLHSSAAGLCHISPILPFPLASAVCSCVPRVGVLFHLFLPEVYHIPFSPSPFSPESLWREPQSSDPPPPFFSSSLCSALQVGGGVSRANPSRRPQLSSAGSCPLGRKCCYCSCHHPRGLVEAHPQDESAKHRCALLFLCLTAASSLLFLPERVRICEGRKLFAQAEPGNDTMTQEILKH